MAIVVSYMIARAILTPPSFREYGFYRGKALAELAAREPVFAGRKACDECHSEVLQKVAKYEHKTISCETCHGPARTHAEDPDVRTTKWNDTRCIRCHEASPARPTWLKQIDLKKHYSGQTCKECHVPHQPQEVP